jgi:hypothetical protein
MKLGDLISAPNILLPKQGVDLTKFAVVACDQFTSQPQYWQELDQLVGSCPSSLRLIFPEAYLGSVNHDQYITSINDNIALYLREGILRPLGPGYILVERSTPETPRRLGLMISIDLEQYSYEPGNDAPIRASEATIVARIPPRLKIREHAPIELPHVLVLFEDKAGFIIESLYRKRSNFHLVYDFELNQHGGHLRGYHITNTMLVEQMFEDLFAGCDLKFIVGDGNHSLATAKAHWDKIKRGLSEAEQQNHPARFSLVEAINLYDEGLSFEPIHRVVFNTDTDFIPGLKAKLSGPIMGHLYTKDRGQTDLLLPRSSPQAYEIVQRYIDDYIRSHPRAEVDYIHGISDLKQITDRYFDAVGIIMPALTKDDVFSYLALGVVLPRKCFSMGHAHEKRYYLESKLIK